jgi:hypothetical protein
MQHLSAISEGEMVAVFLRTQIVGAGQHVSLVLLTGGP